jgi:ring-1,2-phenylacetyl-CoA epoxidase subunit PaaE
MSAATASERRSRYALHTLRVSDIEHLTDDSIVITFDVPDELREVFAFAPGQHVALVRPGGDDVRRSYSICAPAGGALRVGVKLLPHGVFSSYAHEQLKPGDELQVFPPSGRFTTALDPQRVRHYAAIAAGSGITPVLSLLASALAIEPGSRCTLIYGNRTTSSVMFLEELEDLKDRYRDRLHLIYVFSREPQEVELAAGRINGPKLRQILDLLLSPDSVDEWFLCGPFGMVQEARETLTALGVPAAAIHRELFHTDDVPPPEVAWPAAGDGESEGAAVEILLGGRRTALRVPRDGPSMLDAILRERADAPFACKGGVCGTCRCRLLEGEVRMDHAYALEEDELAADLILACQSHPVSDTVVLDFDAV